MPLLTVRLSEADEKALKSLRSKGVRVADLVRDTIHQENRRQASKPIYAKDVKRMLKAIRERNPEPANLPPREVDPCDRQAVRAYIVSRLKRKRLE